MVKVEKRAEVGSCSMGAEEKRNAYINEGGIHHLDKEYTVFGEVIEGFEVIDKIAALPTDGNDRPITDVRIKVRILSE